MKPFWTAILVALAASLPSMSQADRKVSVGRELASLLQCKREPHPAALVVEMARQGYIGAGIDHGVDSYSCFRLRMPLAIPPRDGGPVLKPTWMCIYDWKPDKRYPKLFWRGPGNAPWNTVAVYTNADVPAVQSWSRANRGSPALQISPRPQNKHQPEIDRLTGVSCDGGQFIP